MLAAKFMHKNPTINQALERGEIAKGNTIIAKRYKDLNKNNLIHSQEGWRGWVNEPIFLALKSLKSLKYNQLMVYKR
jgi:hypothetical protein